MGGYVFDHDLVELMGGRFKQARAVDDKGQWFRHPDRPLTFIAEWRGGYKLYERHSSNEWRTLKLIRLGAPRDQRKRNWWLGWNGERLADNADARLLAEHHPRLARWVITTLQTIPCPCP
jgi:hypothetical protein